MRSPVEKEKNRMEIAELYLKGVSQMEIAIQLGVSQPTVSRDIKSMVRLWQRKSFKKIEDKKAIELEKLNRVEAAAWAGWERSIGEIKTTTLQKKDRVTKDGIKALKEAKTVINNQAGDARFLAVITKCIEQRCQILGIPAPNQFGIGLDDKGITLTYTNFNPEQAGFPPPPDPSEILEG